MTTRAGPHGTPERTPQRRVDDPTRLSRRALAGNAPRVALIEDNTDTFVSATLAGHDVRLARRLQQRTPERARIATQPTLELVEVYPYVPYVQYMLPGVIVMSIFMMVMIGGGIIYLDDKARGLHEGIPRHADHEVRAHPRLQCLGARSRRRSWGSP
jgi:ABC-2 type transport system permease protein